MASIDDYNAKLEAITAIPENDAKSPSMPVDAFLGEAEFLYKWCQDDRQALEGVGLEWDLVVDLPARTGALRTAETIWFKNRFHKQGAAQAWSVESKRGYDFRNDLLRTFRHAYRDDPDVLRRVASIAAGRGHVDMIQDLNNLAGLGKAHLGGLLKIRIDPAELDRAATMSDELADLLASSQVEGEDNDRTMIIRDQAYTYLKQAVDEIRASGQYVFWRNEDRFQGYTSQYHKKFSNKARNEPGEPTADVE